MSNPYIRSTTRELSDLEALIKILDKYRGKKVVIEGSETYLTRISNHLDLSTYNVYLNPNPRFGACDIDTPLYDAIQPDVVIHIGHNPFPQTFSSLQSKPYKILFLPMLEALEERKVAHILEALREALDNGKKYGVVYSIQYKKYSDIIVDLLRAEGFNLILPHHLGMLRGQILGCTYRHLQNIDVDEYLVISSGLFHGLGVPLYTGVKTKLVDIHNEKIIDLSDKVNRIRSLIAWNIFRARDYRRAGIIKVVDSHQDQIGGVKAIKNLLEKKGIPYTLYPVYRVSEAVIDNLPRDVLPIIAGCPRIAIDDITRFKRPVLNLEQLQILLGIRDFNEVYPPMRGD